MSKCVRDNQAETCLNLSRAFHDTEVLYESEENKMAVSVDPAQFMEIKKSLEILHGNVDQMFLLFVGSIIFCEYLRRFFTIFIL